MIDPAEVRDLQECLASGGVAVFPADTVYGLCCDPANADAVQRLYELKGRPAERPAAVMFFALASLLRALPEIQARERAALQALLPGPATLLLPNRTNRFPLACGPLEGGATSLGLRVPAWTASLAALGHSACSGAPVERQSLRGARRATSCRRPRVDPRRSRSCDRRRRAAGHRLDGSRPARVRARAVTGSVVRGRSHRRARIVERILASC